MKKLINVISWAGMSAIVIVVVVFQVYTRFTNIDMTETRLLVDYWPVYAGSLLALIVFYLLYDKTK